MLPYRAIPVIVLGFLAVFASFGLTACEQIVRLGDVSGGSGGTGNVGGAGKSNGGNGGASSGAGAIGGAGGLGGTATPGLLWTATFEPGDLSEWVKDGEGGTLSAITADPTATAEIAHTGRYSGKAVLMPAIMPSLDYFLRETPSPPEAYYSAWFYVPATFSVKGWLSIIHFQGSHSGDGRKVFPTWDVNLYPHPDGGGNLAAQLYNFVRATNLQQPQPIPVPLARWVHFEMLVKKATTATGGVAVWQDGTLILKVDNVATIENNWMQWMVGGSTDNISPSVGAVYVDDAAISLTRLGPGG